jgi:diadenosine tetraphosphatase ApaH/serine/threonine PP2A family protein phosphatase
MRIAIISDIHGNLPALEAVQADWVAVDAVWCLGDVVGYGAEPNECVERLQALAAVGIAGNHDWAAIGRIDLQNFNHAAAAAAAWTARSLTPAARAYLEALPTRLDEGEFTLTHGSPREPIEEYLLTVGQAEANFAYFDGVACFIGHSHLPLAFRREPGPPPTVEPVAVTYNTDVPLDDRRFLINVGSVGQPRDGDPAARYLLLDTRERCYRRRRVPYDVPRAQQRIREAGLPEVLAHRLAFGR